MQGVRPPSLSILIAVIYNLEMQIGIILALLLLNLSFGGAEPLKESECPDRDFSFRLGPPYSQGDSYLCHAIVASDLITINQGIGPSEHVSALDVASGATVADPVDALKSLPQAKNFSEKNERSESLALFKQVQSIAFNYKTDMRMGFCNLDILAYNLRANICTERDLPSQASASDRDRANYLFNRVRASMTDENEAPELWRRKIDCNLTSSIKLRNIFDAAEIVGRSLQRGSDTNLRKSCVHTIPLKKMIPHHIVVGADEGARKIANLFVRGIPAGIGFDGGVLRGGKAHREDSDHACTIVGTRWNKGHCEFKLRNSQGPDCKKYRKDWECVEGEGSVWVPEDAMNQMTTDIFYIDRQAKEQ